MSVRFLADESCDFSVVRALRAKGYDVLAVGEIVSRSDDQEVLAQAHRQERVLITEDKDFGWLVFVSGEEDAGVVLIRFPGNLRQTLIGAVCGFVEKHEKELKRAFSVVEPGYIRISPRPGKDKH